MIGSLIVHPRCVIERRHSVDLVNGKKKATYFKPGYIPSIGQIIPHSITIGKKLPIAIYVAVRSLSHADETTKPVYLMCARFFSVRPCIEKIKK